MTEAPRPGRWFVEEYDAHWGGWRKVRLSWMTEDPAEFRLRESAAALADQIKGNRPHARLRVVSE